MSFQKEIGIVSLLVMALAAGVASAGSVSSAVPVTFTHNWTNMGILTETHTGGNRFVTFGLRGFDMQNANWFQLRLLYEGNVIWSGEYVDPPIDLKYNALDGHITLGVKHAAINGTGDYKLEARCYPLIVGCSGKAIHRFISSRQD